MCGVVYYSTMIMRTIIMVPSAYIEIKQLCVKKRHIFSYAYPTVYLLLLKLLTTGF